MRGHGSDKLRTAGAGESRRTRAALGLSAALAVMALLLLLPLPPPLITAAAESVALTAAGKASLAVLAFAVVLWVTETLPFPVTGLLAMVLLVVAGAAPFKVLVRDGFGNPIILFFLGVLIFSAAIVETGLSGRLTLGILRCGRRPATLIFLFLAVGALLSAWITDMAVAAILTPVAVALLRESETAAESRNFGRALLIACAWGPLIGGVATPAGCGPNPLTMSFLHDLAGIRFTFVDWMIVGVPAALLMLPCAWLILLRVFPTRSNGLVISREQLAAQRQRTGPWQRRELWTLTIFLLTVLLWVSGPAIGTWTGGQVDYLDISFVAIGCASLLFLPGIQVLSWKRAQELIAWDGILLVVSGLALGMTVYKTGAAAWLAHAAFSRLGLLPPVLIVFVVVLVVSLLKVLFSSNTVTGVIMVPLLIALAQGLNLDPTLVVIPAGITASLAFILVTSTPTNVIPYAAGYFSIRDMAKAGLLMTVASSVCVTVSLCVIGRLFGIVKF